MTKQDVHNGLNTVLKTMYNLRKEAMKIIKNNNGRIALPQNCYDYIEALFGTNEDGDPELVAKKSNNRLMFVAELDIHEQFAIFYAIAEVTNNNK